MIDIPQIENVDYDTNCPVMDRGMIDMLLYDDGNEVDFALAAELFELFETESQAKLSELGEVCDRSDSEALRRIVHFVAGSAGNLGMARLSAFYRAIEAAIVNKTLDDISSCEAPIRQAFEQARIAFRLDFEL